MGKSSQTSEKKLGREAKVLTYEVKLDGRKIHYRKEKWAKLIDDAISRGLREFGYGDMTSVISVKEILK